MEKLIMLIAVTCFFTCIFCSGTRPLNLGIKNGKLSPCPDSPNCVSSQAEDSEHFIEPISFNGNGAEAISNIIDIIKSMKRTKIIKSANDYLHVEFTSAIFRFVDDVEFYISQSENFIHLRSASRVGYSDMGVNRKRIEAIRKKFSEIQER